MLLLFFLVFFHQLSEAQKFLEDKKPEILIKMNLRWETLKKEAKEMADKGTGGIALDPNSNPKNVCLNLVKFICTTKTITKLRIRFF